MTVGLNMRSASSLVRGFFFFFPPDASAAAALALGEGW